jgi:tetratricopeptide (TPR) repeat protein
LSIVYIGWSSDIQTSRGDGALVDIEKSAWESFEVGFFDEVIQAGKVNPSNSFLSHLSLIARIEDGYIPGKDEFPKGDSTLKLIAEVYFQYSREIHSKDTLKKYLLYLQTKSNPSCLAFLQLGIKLSFEIEEYQACLYIISKDTSGLNEEFYYREKIQCLFTLGKHAELIAYFKKFSQSIHMELNTYMKVGLSLQAMGKFKEAEGLLSKIPGRVKLPTFEEKQVEFYNVIQIIPQLEKRDDLSLEELKELGFAYLFNKQFDKAEKIFQRATTSFARE